MLNYPFPIRSPGSIRHVKWEQVNPDEGIQYLQLDEIPQMIPEPFQVRLDFWESLDLNESHKARRLESREL